MRYDLINLKVSGWTAELSVNLILLLLILLAAGIWLVAIRMRWFGRSDVTMEISLGGIGTVKIKPNYEVKQIAHKAWVELKTRKAGLPIDKDNDVISDVYESWYKLFKEIRLLIREIPASQIRNKDTQKLVDLLIDSLNDGLRPHLTRWRAKYQRWYEKAVSKSEHDNLTPQDIQSTYPEFNELVEDMLKINKLLVEYTDELKKLADA